MTSTRSLRLGSLLTLALAASLGLSSTATAQATKTEAKAKAKEAASKDPIDLNSATAEELQTLPGIGEVTARKIIDGRPHKTVADLAGAGVPASTIDKIKPMVEVKALPTPVDVNVASVDQLESLPGVGAVLAREIVAARPLSGYDDLGKLKGIGPEKLDALKGRVKFGELSVAVAKAKTKEVAEAAKEKMAKVEEKAATAVTKVAEKAKDTMTKAEAKTKEMATKAEAKTKEVATKVEEKTKEKAAEAKEKAAEAKEKILAKIAAGTKVNINTANFETLDALPGIGPVKAQAILDARAGKKFEKIEDIMTVKGIKDGEFAKIKDMITVK